jgi:hypothetical protein
MRGEAFRPSCTLYVRLRALFGHGADTLNRFPGGSDLVLYKLLIVFLKLVPAGGFEPPTY